MPRWSHCSYQIDTCLERLDRGRGLSKWLVACVLEHPELQGLRRWMLASRDAHGLYERFGFTALGDPGKFMEIARPGLYRETGPPDQVSS